MAEAPAADKPKEEKKDNGGAKGPLKQVSDASGVSYVLATEEERQRRLVADQVFAEALNHVLWGDLEKAGALNAVKAIEKGATNLIPAAGSVVVRAPLYVIGQFGKITRFTAKGISDRRAEKGLENALGLTPRLSDLKKMEAYGYDINFDQLLAANSPYREKLEKDVINSKKAFKDRYEALADIAWKMAYDVIGEENPNKIKLRQIAAVIAEALARVVKLGSSAVSMGEDDTKLHKKVLGTIKAVTKAFQSQKAMNTVVKDLPDGLELDFAKFDGGIMFDGSSDLAKAQIVGGYNKLVENVKKIKPVKVEFSQYGNGIMAQRAALGLRNDGKIDENAPAQEPNKYFLANVWRQFVQANSQLSALQTAGGQGTAIYRAIQNYVFYRWLKKIDVVGDLQRKYTGKELDGAMYLGEVIDISADNAKKRLGEDIVAKKDDMDKKGKVYVIPQLKWLDNAFYAADFSGMLSSLGYNAKSQDNDPSNRFGDDPVKNLKKLLGLKDTAPGIDKLNKIVELVDKVKKLEVHIQRQQIKHSGQDKAQEALKKLSELLAAIKIEATQAAPGFIGDMFKNSTVLDATAGKIVDAIRLIIGPDQSAFGGLFGSINSLLPGQDGYIRLHDGAAKFAAAFNLLTPDQRNTSVENLSKILKLPQHVLLGKSKDAKVAPEDTATQIQNGTVSNTTLAGVSAYFSANAGVSRQFANARDALLNIKLQSTHSIPLFKEDFYKYYIDPLPTEDEKNSVIKQVLTAINSGKEQYASKMMIRGGVKPYATDWASFINTIDLDSSDLKTQFDRFLEILGKYPSLSRLLADVSVDKTSYGRTVFSEIGVALRRHDLSNIGLVDKRDIDRYKDSMVGLIAFTPNTPAGPEKDRKKILMAKFISDSISLVADIDISQNFYNILKKFATEQEILEAVEFFLTTAAPAGEYAELVSQPTLALADDPRTLLGLQLVAGSQTTIGGFLASAEVNALLNLPPNTKREDKIKELDKAYPGYRDALFAKIEELKEVVKRVKIFMKASNFLQQRINGNNKAYLNVVNQLALVLNKLELNANKHLKD